MKSIQQYSYQESIEKNSYIGRIDDNYLVEKLIIGIEKITSQNKLRKLYEVIKFHQRYIRSERCNFLMKILEKKI